MPPIPSSRLRDESGDESRELADRETVGACMPTSTDNHRDMPECS